jgi:hypothetical protein
MRRSLATALKDRNEAERKLLALGDENSRLSSENAGLKRDLAAKVAAADLPNLARLMAIEAELADVRAKASRLSKERNEF